MTSSYLHENAVTMTSEVIARGDEAAYELSRGAHEEAVIRRRDLMNNIDSIVQRYLATFNETDARQRSALLQQIYTEDATYIDPHADLEGPAAIHEFIGAIQNKYPGVTFMLAGKVDAHHAQARFTWHAMAQGVREPVAIGFDVIALEKGRIRRVYGFLDKSPS